MPRKKSGPAQIDQSYLDSKVNTKLEAGKRAFAERMAATIYELSMICREMSWHKTGVHLYVAAEELENMVEKAETAQLQYLADRRNYDATSD